MNRRTKLLAAGAVLAGAIAASTGVAVAGGDDDATDTPLTGDDLARASAVAVAHAGGGRVTATEVDQEAGDYEIEVTLDDGSQVDVDLDKDFRVIRTDSHEGAGS